jgi:hypothetical protein
MLRHAITHALPAGAAHTRRRVLAATVTAALLAGASRRPAAATIAQAAHRYTVTGPTELFEALETVQPGDEIALADGVYAGDFILARSGTAMAPIVVRAENPGRAVLRGRLMLAAAHGLAVGLQFDGGSVAIEGDDCRVSRCRFVGSSGAAIQIRAPSRRAEIDHNEIRDFDFRGIFGDATRSSHPIEPHIHHNHLIRQLSERGGGIIIGVERAHTEHRFAALVEYNLVEQFNGIEPISAKSSGNIFRFNTVQDADGSLMCRHGRDNLYIGNSSLNAGGIFLHGKSNLAIGNYLDGRKSGRWRDHVAARGNIGQDDFKGGGDDGTHPYAEECLFAGNIGRLRIGEGSERWPLPALGTRVAGHQGDIMLRHESGTRLDEPVGMPIPPYVVLTRSDVGPDAGTS